MQNLTTISQASPAELQLINTSKQLCESAADVIIMTRADLSAATDLVKIIKNRSKEIDEERTRLVRPFNDGVKAINARFKAMTQPLEDAEIEIKGKMLTFQKQEEVRARQEQERINAKNRELEEAARKKAEEESNGEDIRSMPLPDQPITIVASSHRPTTYGQTGAVSTVKKVWAFEITDIKALAVSRPDLVLANDTEINREIRGKGGNIAGLNIYEKEIIQVR